MRQPRKPSDIQGKSIVSDENPRSFIYVVLLDQSTVHGSRINFALELFKKGKARSLSSKKMSSLICKENNTPKKIGVGG